MDIIKELKALPNHISPWREWLDFPNQYTEYSRILKELNPSSIFEIGTCLGYFLCTAAFSCENLKEIYWVDNESYSPNTNKLAKKNIETVLDKLNRSCLLMHSNKYPFKSELSLIKNYFNGRQLDLVHIDGDHSYGGCLFDLNFALDLNPKIIIGHDINLEKGVKQAVERFCDYNELKYEVINSLNNGLYIIRP